MTPTRTCSACTAREALVRRAWAKSDFLMSALIVIARGDPTRSAVRAARRLVRMAMEVRS